jgi:hypothetical protein
MLEFQVIFSSFSVEILFQTLQKIFLQVSDRAVTVR